MVFADTSGWYAAFVPIDVNYRVATTWLKSNRKPLFTTDYCVSETLTLMRARRQPQKAIEFGEYIFQSSDVILHYLTRADILAAWEIFYRFRDKEWSFTDCTSKVVIENLSIAEAFAFDHHFHQFGTVAVVP